MSSTFNDQLINQLISFACVHGLSSNGSENPYDVKIKCECGDGVGEPLLETPSVSFQTIHEEFVTDCVADSTATSE